MSVISSEITGLGAYLPERIVTNDELTELLKVDRDWIYKRTGIRQRHVAAAFEVTSDLAAHAASAALQDAGIEPEALNLILVATSTPDMMMPSTATQVQRKIGATNAAALDINAACSGFVYGLVIADQFIRTGSMHHILVIGADTFTRYVDRSSSHTSIIFGDGAGALIVSRTTGEKGLLYFELGANGDVPKEWLMLTGNGSARNELSDTSPGINTIKMNGPAVFEFGARIIARIVDSALAKTHLRCDDIKLIIPHQANSRIVKLAAEISGISMDKYYLDIDFRANTASASIPIAMYDAHAANRMQKGDTIILAGFGAGFTWAGALLRF